MRKPILCLDFDGVCHSYIQKWQGAHVIPDEYVPGLFEFLEAAKKHFDIHIFSTRSVEEAGREAMVFWFVEQRKLWRSRNGKPPDNTPLELSFPDKKPPAFVSLDDRSLLFTGVWPEVEELVKFKPWNKKGTSA